MVSALDAIAAIQNRKNAIEYTVVRDASTGMPPTQCRSCGSTTANGALALTFPSLIDAVGITGTFFLFAAVGAVALAFIATQVPETRGRTLEGLEADTLSGALFRRRERG